MQRLFLSIILYLCLSVWVLPAYAENIAVIVNEQSPLFIEVKDSFQIKDARDIYLGKKRFWGKSLIKPLNQRNEKILSTFIKKVCAMNLNEYKHHLVVSELESGMDAPKVLESSTEVKEQVRTDRSMVGYIWENEANDVQGIRVILLFSE